MANAVELLDVSKVFGAHVAVNAVTLAVPEGSVYGFIGPNGSGKTTTLRMISRIYLPSRGTVRVLGETDQGPSNDFVGYLPEERGLYNQMKVGELLRFYAQIKSYNPTRAEITQWLERVELAAYENQRVRTLSKGMSQKLQFVATAISKPKLLLLDEPFSGLDPVNAVVLRDLVADLRSQGATIIFSTHDMRLAEEMCDFIFMIYKGNKVLDGTLTQIRQTYGRDVLRVRLHGRQLDGSLDLPGVQSIDDLGNVQELRLRAGADTQVILRKLLEFGTIDQFELTSPSLQDIFVRIAAPEKEAIATLG
ncbi:MAG: ATP-binding cassette domain-containing protein [Tepidisphaeraceae bacterium]